MGGIFRGWRVLGPRVVGLLERWFRDLGFSGCATLGCGIAEKVVSWPGVSGGVTCRWDTALKVP